MENCCCIILAAGEGTRMKSKQPKVLSEVLFEPMLEWVIHSVTLNNIEDLCFVIGYQHEVIENYLSQRHAKKRYQTVLQRERKGTAHAVMMADAFLQNHRKDSVLILAGDAPFIDADTIHRSFLLHTSQNHAATIISSKVKNPYGYGRILRDPRTKSITAIVEQKDADSQIEKIDEVNSGAYWFEVDSLLSVLYEISNHNSQKEYYLPDAIHLLLKKGRRVAAFISDSQETVLGANNQEQLQALNQIARKKVLKNLMKQGIEIPCMDGVIVGPKVKIGAGSRILPGTIIRGQVEIGHYCEIGPNSLIEDSIIGDFVCLNSVYCSHQSIPDKKMIPPYTSLK